MKKKLIALLLAVVTFITVLPLEAFAYGSASRYPAGADAKPSSGGATADGGYRVSVQMLTLDKPVSNYNSSNFVYKMSEAIRDTYSKKLPCGNNKAIYFFNFRESDRANMYVAPGNTFDIEYNAKDSDSGILARYRTWDGTGTVSGTNKDVVVNNDVEWVGDPTRVFSYGGANDLQHTYDEIEKVVTEYMSSTTNINNYLNYLEDIFTANKKFAYTSSYKDNNGNEVKYNVYTYYMATEMVNGTFYRNGQATLLFHTLLLAKLTDADTEIIKEFSEKYNAGKEIQQVPVILVESLTAYIDSNWNMHALTLAQWIAKIKSLSNNKAQDVLYENKKSLTKIADTKCEYIDSFLNPLTTLAKSGALTNENAKAYAWSSYGLIDNPDNNEVFGVSKETGKWKSSTSGFSRMLMISNNDTTVGQKYLSPKAGCVYPGYSMFWMEAPLVGSEPATYNAQIKAVWWDTSDDTDPVNGLGKAERTRDDPKVGAEAHYAVTGYGLTKDSAMIKWLESDAGKNLKYTLDISIYNSKLTTKTDPKVTVDDQAHYSPSTKFAKYSSMFSGSLKINDNAVPKSGYIRYDLSSKDIINFLLGNKCVYFYSDRYKDSKKTDEKQYFVYSGAHISIYPTGHKDSKKFVNYPWESTPVEISSNSLTYSVTNPPNLEGSYNVQDDESFSNKVIDYEKGYYLYEENDGYWTTTMNIEELPDFVSMTDGLTADNIGELKIDIGAKTKLPLFYDAAKNFYNGYAKCTASSNGLSAAEVIHDYKSSKDVSKQVIDKLEIAMAKAYNSALLKMGRDVAYSDTVTLTKEEVLAFRNMVISKQDWGITGHVNKGTWQNVGATTDMSFYIKVTWNYKNKDREYTLSAIEDTVTKSYPCSEPAIKSVQNKYHVDALPDAKVIKLNNTSSMEYDLGKNGEVSNITTSFTVEDLARYNYAIACAKETNKGTIEVTITRADDDGSSDVFTSRGDKLELYNAGQFHLKRKTPDGNVWVWDGSNLSNALEEFKDNEFQFQDNLEQNMYILSGDNPSIMFCYKVEISMTVEKPNNAGTLNINWEPDPAMDTVSWLAEEDLYFNSAIDKNFAEIKEGSPTKEKYEAMSGVPVTANLYFATGGHEFVVNTSYSIKSFNPTRVYEYSANESACDESWIQTGDSRLNCIKVSDCDNHELVETYTAGADGTCELKCDKTEDIISCEDAGCTVEGCTETHTKPHKHGKSCYKHSGGSSDTLGDAVTEYCSAGPWTKTYYKLDGEKYVCETCGVEYLRAKAHTEKCKGPGNGSYSVYIQVPESLQSGVLKSHSWSHCNCHCPAGQHWECNPHTALYTEKWETNMTTVYYTCITQCYVWRLAANYLTVNEDLLESEDVIYSEWLPTEDDISAPGYLYFWSGDTAHLKSNRGNILGRLHYFWQDGLHAVEVDMNGDVTDVYDYVSLNMTMHGSTNYAGDLGKTYSGDLYTCDDCDCPSVGGREGHTYDKLHEYYLKWIKDDGGDGQRFGMTVVSDFLFYSANNNDVQSIYYNEYNLYAGSSTSMSDKGDKKIYNVAGFGTSDTKGNKQSKAASTVDAADCFKTTINKDGTEVQINNANYNLNSSGFLWEKNSTCVGYVESGKQYIGTHDLARVGFNGLEPTDNATIETKYTPENKQNFTYSSNRAVMKYWTDYYMEGFLRHKYKNLSPAVCTFDTGKYQHICPTEGGLPKPPEKQPKPFYLGVEDLDIRDTAINGLYKSGKAANFYEIQIEFDPGNRGSIYSVKNISWAGNATSTETSKGFAVSTTYCTTDAKTDNRYVNEVIVYVPSAADLGLGIRNGTTPFIDDRVDPSASRYIGINLEADGIIDFPLISEIQEIPDNASSFKNCVHAIGKGYGGYGNTLDVIKDPFNGKRWVNRKWITVSNYVIVDTDGDGSFTDEHVYAPYEEIELKIFDSSGNYLEEYAFYLPEMAYESAAVSVTFYTSAINGTVSENTDDWMPNNVDEVYSTYRDFYRYHGASDYRMFEAVGRIGNLTMVDTGDFRYSNFFKASTGEWLVPNVVYKVDSSEQVRVVIDEYDIFDRKGGGESAWNTYGSQTHKEELTNSEPSSSYDIISGSGTRRTHYYALPLLPKYNNIEAFKDTPMRVGYKAYLDVETIGSYYQGTNYVTVEYSYYGMDKNNNLAPLDVYMLKDGAYVLINDFYNNYDKITQYPVYMKWEDENERRMYTDIEDKRTKEVNSYMEGTYAFDMYTGETSKVYPYYPSGNTTYQGDYNSLILGFDSRTFIGDYYYDDVMPGFPDNDNTNVGGYIDAWMYYRNSQKWYFSNELPSSAVFVEAGQKCTKENIDATTAKYNKAVVTGIITAHGSVWNLRHDGSNSWAKLREVYPPTSVTPPPYPPSNPPTPTDPTPPPGSPDTPTPTVITIIPIPETSRDDVTTIGTH